MMNSTIALTGEELDARKAMRFIIKLDARCQAKAGKA